MFLILFGSLPFHSFCFIDICCLYSITNAELDISFFYWMNDIVN
ncbi:6146_t:CDS:2 [Gigaspora margarita]|uniref:6146_t:CDS:1 n=1 Tax=Gigaspora margarita TaxID=4874 RepID=A0ABM8W4I8_GIGMA|nr:6146_t:CDS:2 [Gigaspora margarita]